LAALFLAVFLHQRRLDTLVVAAPSSEPGKIFGDRSTLVVLFGFGSVALPWTLRLDLRVRSRLSFFVVATGIFRVVHKILGFSSHPAFSPWVSAAFSLDFFGAKFCLPIRFVLLVVAAGSILRVVHKIIGVTSRSSCTSWNLD